MSLALGATFFAAFFAAIRARGVAHLSPPPRELARFVADQLIEVHRALR